MRHRILGAVGALALACAAAPAAASADLLDTTVSSAAAQKRTCQAGPATGTGVVQRTVTASASGLISGTLAGQGAGDWDLAIFDKATGRTVAASASYGLDELAQGVAAKGQI